MLCLPSPPFIWVYLFLHLMLLTSSYAEKQTHANNSPETPKDQNPHKIEQQVANLQLQAVQAARKQSYDEALQLLTQAQQLQHDNKTLFLIAKVHSRAKHCIQGLAAWKNLLKMCNTECRFYQQAISLEAEHEQVCQASILIQGVPNKTQVYLNGKAMGETPIEYKLAAGTYLIELKHEGYITQSFKKVLKPNDKERLTYSLQNDHLASLHHLQKNMKQNPTFIVRQTISHKKTLLPIIGLIVGSVGIASSTFFLFQAWDEADSIRQTAKDTIDERDFNALVQDHKEQQSSELIAWGFLGSSLIISLVSGVFLIKESTKHQVTKVQVEPSKTAQQKFNIQPYANLSSNTWGISLHLDL